MRDVVFAATVAALARYVDIVRYDGATAHGVPATLGHFKRYAACLVAVSLAVWALVHGSAAL